MNSKAIGVFSLTMVPSDEGASFHITPIKFNSNGSWSVGGKQVSHSWRNGESLPPVHEIVRDLRSFGPLISRHNSEGDSYELLFRRLAIDILSLSHALIDAGVVGVVFGTGVTHHLDSLTLEFACRYSGIRQYFLYPFPPRFRLLPVTQVAGIPDRRPATFRVSQADHCEDLEAIRSGAVKKWSQDMLIGAGIERVVGTSALLSVVAIYGRFMQSALHRRTRKGDGLTRFSATREAVLTLRLLSARRRLAQLATASPSSRTDNTSLLIFAHFQPEATAFPEGGILNNHVDLVSQLRRMGYSGDIFYREHPGYARYTWNFYSSRGGTFRDSDYYEQLRSLGVLFLRDSSLNSLHKTQSAMIPVTLTGTIALERSLHGLPCLVGGLPWYRGLPGTISLQDFETWEQIAGALALLGSRGPEKVSSDAMGFLLRILNEKTVGNPQFIGGIRPPASRDRDWDDAVAEMRLLFEHIASGAS